MLRDKFDQPVRMEELADAARMSPSSFYQHFRTLTSMTPLQYQKQLRLLEARRRMLADEVNVESAAFGVGYESASQFSREYARMFGTPPKDLDYWRAIEDLGFGRVGLILPTRPLDESLRRLDDYAAQVSRYRG